MKGLVPQLPRMMDCSSRTTWGMSGKKWWEREPQKPAGKEKGVSLTTRFALLHSLPSNDLAAFLLARHFSTPPWEKSRAGLSRKASSSSLHNGSYFCPSHRASQRDNSCARLPWLLDGGHPSGDLKGGLRLGGNDSEPDCSKNTAKKGNVSTN